MCILFYDQEEEEGTDQAEKVEETTEEVPKSPQKKSDKRRLGARGENYCTSRTGHFLFWDYSGKNYWGRGGGFWGGGLSRFHLLSEGGIQISPIFREGLPDITSQNQKASTTQ